MIASASVEARSFYERYVMVAGKPTNSREGKEWACSCPLCGGVDRASFWESGRFCCVRGCQAHASSPYWFLRDVLRYDHHQACYELGCDPLDAGARPARPPLPLCLTKDEPPNQRWQEAAQAFCRAAENYLWSAKGETALHYLHARRLNDETIRQAHLGLCPDWYKAPLEAWGLSPEQLGKEDDPQIKIPRGIVIPWFVDGALWKIQLRRPAPGPDGKKYKEVLGSAECLYHLDSLSAGRPALLVESELDALSAQQEAGDLLACLATGSTSKALTPRTLAQLAQAAHILQCFDTDDAGERGAQEWIQALSSERCTRWTPWAHDVNQMLQDRQPVRLWIETGLQMISTENEPVQGDRSVPPARTSWPYWENHLHSLEERIALFCSRPCAGCGGYDWMLDTDGLLVCPCVVEKRQKILFDW